MMRQAQSRIISTESTIINDNELEQLSALLLDSDLDRLFTQIKNCEKQNASVLLMVGTTGSGKSTLFNWLNGAKFSFKGVGIGSELILSPGQSMEYSLMKRGRESVTVVPKSYYNKTYNHLVIDFPGFEDTRGWVYQFIHYLTMNKLIRTCKLKLVVVIEHPENTFRNRGSQILPLVLSLFQGVKKTDEITLILNQYFDDNTEAEVAFSAYEQLEELQKQEREQKKLDVLEALKKNIIVMRKIRRQNQIETIMGEQTLRAYWQKLLETKPIKFEPFEEFDHIHKISIFLQNKTQKFYDQTSEFLTNANSLLSELSIDELTKLIELLSQKNKLGKDLIQFENTVEFCSSIHEYAHFHGLPEIHPALIQLYEMVKGQNQFDVIIEEASQRLHLKSTHFISKLKSDLIEKKKKAQIDDENLAILMELQFKKEQIAEETEMLRRQKEEQLQRIKSEQEKQKLIEEQVEMEKKKQEEARKQSEEKIKKMKEKHKKNKEALKKKNDSWCSLI